MKKTLYLARCIVALLVTMLAAMFYAPTASATTDLPISAHADEGKAFMTEQPAALAPSVAAFKRLNLFRTRQTVDPARQAQARGFILKPVAENSRLNVKDDPHIK